MAKNKVVIFSKFIIFAVTKTTRAAWYSRCRRLWFAQNSLPLRWQRQHGCRFFNRKRGCDLLKIHYLCGDKDNRARPEWSTPPVVICSKFITFAVTKTTWTLRWRLLCLLWFAQNSLPLRWQRQHTPSVPTWRHRCDLLKIHYLCGDKDNSVRENRECF